MTRIRHDRIPKQRHGVDGSRKGAVPSFSFSERTRAATAWATIQPSSHGGEQFGRASDMRKTVDRLLCGEEPDGAVPQSRAQPGLIQVDVRDVAPRQLQDMRSKPSDLTAKAVGGDTKCRARPAHTRRDDRQQHEQSADDDHPRVGGRRKIVVTDDHPGCQSHQGGHTGSTDEHDRMQPGLKLRPRVTLGHRHRRNATWIRRLQPQHQQSTALGLPRKSARAIENATPALPSASAGRG